MVKLESGKIKAFSEKNQQKKIGRLIYPPKIDPDLAPKPPVDEDDWPPKRLVDPVAEDCPKTGAAPKGFLLALSVLGADPRPLKNPPPPPDPNNPPEEVVEGGAVDPPPKMEDDAAGAGAFPKTDPDDG